jgi:hypothetical protein
MSLSRSDQSASTEIPTMTVMVPNPQVMMAVVMLMVITMMLLPQPPHSQSFL